MDDLFQPLASVRLSDSAVNQIRELIMKGRLKPGDQLPGERELVRQFGVSRASIREALRALEATGLIEVKPGLGTFVRGMVLEDDPAQRLAHWLQNHEDELMELVELRQALETRAASLAAQRATAAQIKAIKTTLNDLAEGVEDNNLARMVAADSAFHEMVAFASGNRLMAQLLNAAVQALSNPREAILSLPGRAGRSLQEHRAISKAIEVRDPVAAEAAMVAHIEGVMADVQRIKSGEQED